MTAFVGCYLRLSSLNVFIGYLKYMKRYVLILGYFGLLLLMGIAGVVEAQPASENLLQLPVKSFEESQIKLSYHQRTGKVRFLQAESGHAIRQSTPLPSTVSTEEAARVFLDRHGAVFGLHEQKEELKLIKIKTASQGRSFVRFQQFYQGIPVIGGELITQMDAAGNLMSINGEILPDIAVDAAPAIPTFIAQQTALMAIAREYEQSLDEFTATEPELWLYNPLLLGVPDRSKNRLVWRLEVTLRTLGPIRELVLIDAQTGEVALHFNQIDAAKNRRTYNAQNSYSLPGLLCWAEGDGPSGDPDCDNAHEYAASAYDFYMAEHDRDSINNAGMPIISSVHYGNDYCNAFWNGSQMTYGDGCEIIADDVVAHELTHGVTDYESDLFYIGQSGAINESFSDIWGEFVDLTNGVGNDSLEVRWQMGEDTSTGASRNLQNPTLYNDPDRMTSSHYYCGFGDNGGVHTNNGIGNKATFLMVDGGSFNGYTITGLGISKVADLFYEVQTNLLTSAANYADLYDALLLACGNLGYSSFESQQVQNALDATEMNHLSACPVDIEVIHNSTSVPNGGHISIGTGGVGESRTLDFTIKNTGDTFLDLTGSPVVQISGTHAGDFTVIAQPATPVEPFWWNSFRVRFTPGALGERTARVTIPNTDPDENPFTFIITGTGVEWIPFTEMTEVTDFLPDVSMNDAAWSDYDNDGDLDILLTGYLSGYGYLARIYRNDGSGTLTDIRVPLPGVIYASVAWGDYDNDSDLDILFTGGTSLSNYLTRIYRNNDNETFTNISIQLPKVAMGSVAWGDYDNDGDLDILLTGLNWEAGSISRVYRNNGDETFTDVGVELPGVHWSTGAWGDYDSDGDLDILLEGDRSFSNLPLVFNPISGVYRNDGPSQDSKWKFTDIDAKLPEVPNSVAWGDYDNDGDLDILLAGWDGATPISKVYRNNGDGTFTDIVARLTGISGSSSWGDYDNDGDLDILLTGSTGSGSPNMAKVYRNNGNGTFTDIVTGFTAVSGLSIWGDYDNDGDLDILVLGTNGFSKFSTIYRNNALSTNVTPASPTDLSASPIDQAVTLSWNQATDSETPSQGLSYNLRVGTTPGGSDIVSPMANPLTGERLVVQLGNVNQNTTWTLKNLLPGTYYWSVQAIDTTFAGSPFASEESFTVSVPEIQIKQGNAVIPGSTGSYDFGLVKLDSSTTVTFTVENTGLADLTLDGSPRIQTSGDHAGDFVVTRQPSSPIASNSSVTFDIQFTPSAMGGRTATVSIVNNDADENPYTFTLTGTGDPQFTLIVTKTGTSTGTVTSNPIGIDCGPDCTETYISGTVVILTATPAIDSVFTGWSDTGCSGTGGCVVTMDTNKTVTANFIYTGVCGGADEVLDYTIQSGEIVNCRATNSIRLTPGFHAEEGSTFRGYIEEEARALNSLTNFYMDYVE